MGGRAIVLAALCCVARGWDVGQAWNNRAAPAATRAALLLANMTLDEKLAMLHGPPAPMPCCECKPTDPGFAPGCAYTGNVAANPRLGIPPLNMNDGPQGFRDNFQEGSTTAWPSGLAIAASWSPAAARAWGAAMGREFYAKGANVQLGPGLCVARVPQNGRNFEYTSGEDPVLGASLAPAVVEGIQTSPVIATAKHFVDNSQETDRMTVTEVVDERTQFELYLPPFAAAARSAGAVMCSYNKVRIGGGAARWACENPDTLNGQLKGKLNFSGFVMSDWTATHSLSLPEGLDMEMPGADYLGADAVRAALAAGTVVESVVDAAVGRILAAMFRVGVMDAPAGAYNASHRLRNVTSAAARRLSRSLSANATVLLRNEAVPAAPNTMGRSAATQPMLPLDRCPGPGAKIAVLGLVGAGSAISHGTGSGQVVPAAVLTPCQGVGEALAAAGPDCGSAVCVEGTDAARAAAVAANATAALVFVGVVSGEGSDRSGVGLPPAQDALVRAVAAAQPATAAVVSSPGAVMLPWSRAVPAVLANFMPGEQAGGAAADVLFGVVNPSAKLPLTFPNVENETQLSVGQWPGTTIPPPQGFCENGTYATGDMGCYNISGGGWPGLSGVLHDGDPNTGNMTWAYVAQRCNALGYAYAAVNGGNGAVMQCANTLPPQASRLPEDPAGGYNQPLRYNLCNKTACSGNHSESCGGDGWHTNFTVRPTRALSYTCTADEHPPPRTFGNTEATYSEGLEVGYRWYDAHSVAPAFPFGHGLSYTTFSYSNLTASATAVTVDVQNTGKVDGAEVAQLYLGFPASAGEPPKQLKGFEKVQLKAGETRTVTFPLDDRAVSVWDVQKHAWSTVSGDFSVMVGASSRDIHLTTKLSL